MENRFNLEQPEDQGWGSYAKPPQYGNQGETPGSSTQTLTCEHVREYLPELSDDTNTVNPTVSAAVYAHLAMCRACAVIFDELRRVVRLVESLTPVDPPADFGPLVLRRIASTLPEVSALERFPTSAASSSAFEEAANQTSAEAASTASPLATAAAGWERFVLGAILTAMMAAFLSTDWGRAMLGVNAAAAASWLSAVRDGLEAVPIMGSMVAHIYSALAVSMNDIADAWNNLGERAAVGFASDVALGAVAVLIMRRRQQRRRERGNYR